MKLLFFPVVLLSPLDAAIWLEVDARMDGEREYALHVEARKADRRDAELMLTAQVARAHGSWDPIAINRVGRFGGYLPAKRPQVWLS